MCVQITITTLHLFSQKNKPLKMRREVHYLFPQMRSISHFAFTSLAQALLRDIMSTEGLLLTTLLIYASQPASGVQSIRALLEDYLLFTCFLVASRIVWIWFSLAAVIVVVVTACDSHYRSSVSVLLRLLCLFWLMRGWSLHCIFVGSLNIFHTIAG